MGLFLFLLTQYLYHWCRNPITYNVIEYNGYNLISKNRVGLGDICNDPYFIGQINPLMRS